MGDKDKKSMFQAASDLRKTEPGTALSTWQILVRVIAIGIPVLGAIPTAYNLYLAYKHDRPVGQISHDMEQAELWNKNAECLFKMKFQALETGKGTRVNIASCPDSNDLLVKVATSDGELANNEWISYDSIVGQKTGFSIFASLIDNAYAADVVKKRGPQSKPRLRVADEGMKIVCQKIDKKGKVLQIVKENNKCYKEEFSIYKGNIQGRLEVPCETTCNGKTKS